MSRASHHPNPSDLDQISEILPYLCIGSYGAAEREEYLKTLQVTHTLCLLDEMPNAISPRPFIESARDAGGRLLIFCASGINRSPALAAAYLQVALHYPMDSALAVIAKSRPIVSIHERYLKQLAALPASLPA
jgi:hypothetical protein